MNDEVTNTAISQLEALRGALEATAWLSATTKCVIQRQLAKELHELADALESSSHEEHRRP